MYILIAYKPSNYDSRCGSHYSSDFYQGTFNNQIELLKQWSNLCLENKKADWSEGEYVFSVYVNGILYLEENQYRTPYIPDEEWKEETEKLHNGIASDVNTFFKHAQNNADNLYKAYQEQQRINKEQEKQNELRRKEKCEREQYEKLHAKFGVGPATA